jgi:spore maturation protein A
MVMSYIWFFILLISVVFALLTGNGSTLAAAIPQGAQAGITLAFSLAGSICLWSGVGALMERIGATTALAKLLSPALNRLFPSAKTDPILAGDLSANICANFLGLGNAATPMGIRAAKRLVDPARPELATDQLCRLIVLNTASIQLIPANVAAVRSNLGSAAPFDILPAVWITSICSVSVGLLAAWLLGKLWKHG